MSKTKVQTFRYRFGNETKTFWYRSRICLFENITNNLKGINREPGPLKDTFVLHSHRHLAPVLLPLLLRLDAGHVPGHLQVKSSLNR